MTNKNIVHSWYFLFTNTYINEAKTRIRNRHISIFFFLYLVILRRVPRRPRDAVLLSLSMIVVGTKKPLALSHTYIEPSSVYGCYIGSLSLSHSIPYASRARVSHRTWKFSRESLTPLLPLSIFYLTLYFFLFYYNYLKANICFHNSVNLWKLSITKWRKKKS